MKKSKTITLSAIFLAAILSCNDDPKDEWVAGDTTSRDTVMNNNRFRLYHGFWYPVYNNLINPGRYNGATSSEITSRSYHPSIRTGGFGSSGHFSATS